MQGRTRVFARRPVFDQADVVERKKLDFVAGCPAGEMFALRSMR